MEHFLILIISTISGWFLFIASLLLSLLEKRKELDLIKNIRSELIRFKKDLEKFKKDFTKIKD
jgi:hypothetical protein